MGITPIQQPSAFIAGSKDVVRYFVPDRDGFGAVDQLCLDLRVNRIIEGVGHWVQQEASDLVNDALLEFLASVPG